MNKAELVDSLVANSAFRSKAEAKRALSQVLEGMRRVLADGHGLQLVGFGSFRVCERRPRKGRNPRTQEIMEIPACKTVVFKPARALRENISVELEERETQAPLTNPSPGL